ncbi:MAG: PadR family transcriptional regulator [Luteitalea sp.]|nr:PadR family transcriptional regulator [Luteitalea sp.]
MCGASAVQSGDQTVSHTTLTLLQGTVDLLILRALQQGPAHGYAVSRWVRERTDGVLSMEDAALYQGLHRLEDKGWIASEWGLSENNRRAKYYELTTRGRRQLRSEVSVWKQYAEAVFKVLETA